MSFQRMIAFKHMTHRRKTGFISLISMISVGGVAVGVMALIVVLAVMSGFDRELKSKIVNVQPHIRIERFGGIQDAYTEQQKIRNLNIEGLRHIAGFVEGQAILRSRDNATGVIVKGLDQENEDMSIYASKLVSGELEFQTDIIRTKKRTGWFFKKTIETEVPSLFIGQTLARKLHVRAGDTVTLIAPFQDPNKPFSLLNAETQLFKIAGIFRIGMNDFDTGLVIVSMRDAQKLYHLGDKVSGLSLRFNDVDDAEKWKYRLRESFTNDYVIRSWYDMNRNFFQALKVEKSVMTILLGLIILVATFNIVSTLTMVVMEKTKDIGILRAIGATRANIRNIFVIEGFSIGSIGIAVGTGLGLALAFNLNQVSDFLKKTTGLEVFPSDIYFFDKIPAEVHSGDVTLIVTFALIASILAGLYPSYRAAKLNPVEALRYE